MLNRRRFLQIATIAPAVFGIPQPGLAQSADPKPDFDIAGNTQTDPAGYEIAWSSLWTNVDVGPLRMQPVPGQTGFVVLDSEERQVGQRLTSRQRVVLETNAISGPVDPEELLNSFEDDHPSTHFQYAPGTVIESRHLTDQGCWISMGPGPNGGGFEGVIGLSLYYTPPEDGLPLLNVKFTVSHGSFRTPEFLEEMDSTISINGNWLLAMDDLESFWDAIENSYGYPDSVF